MGRSLYGGQTKVCSGLKFSMFLYLDKNNYYFFTFQTTLERNQVPEFLLSVPIRKTRAGLQFTCAAPTLGVQRDVWVCNSDGYVGQVCVLSLVPEPTVTSCNGFCNARILCVSSVPAGDE